VKLDVNTLLAAMQANAFAMAAADPAAMGWRSRGRPVPSAEVAPARIVDPARAGANP
jgi:hypothetical protein